MVIKSGGKDMLKNLLNSGKHLKIHIFPGLSESVPAAFAVCQRWISKYTIYKF